MTNMTTRAMHFRRPLAAMARQRATLRAAGRPSRSHRILPVRRFAGPVAAEAIQTTNGHGTGERRQTWARHAIDLASDSAKVSAKDSVAIVPDGNAIPRAGQIATFEIVEEIEKRLTTLEKESCQLEPTPELRAHVRNKVVDYTERFINQIEDLPPFNESKSQGAGIHDLPITEDATPVEEVLRTFEDEVDFPGLNPASGGHLGYIPGGGIYYSSVADYLADISNRFAGLFSVSPGAVRMENMLIRWMADMVGYPAEAAGTHTSGGSIANLIAIVSARQAAGLKGGDLHKAVIYASSHKHHCVDRGIHIAGLAECQLRHVPLDKHWRINASELSEMIEADKEAGLNPFLVIASAGTTDIGAVDPLDDIADVAEAHNLWFHVDAAYGGFFLLCDELRPGFKGIERSDSVVMDPHKGLFLPYGSGVVLVRDPEPTMEAHAYRANYVQDPAFGEELSPAYLSPEFSRSFRGLRLWLPLQLHGVAPFRACLEEKYQLARYFWHRLETVPGVERGPFPDLSVVAFRYVPARGDPESFNKKLVEGVRRDGRVFLSSTKLDGKFVIRFACLAFRTHKGVVDLCLEVLKNQIAELESLPEYNDDNADADDAA